MSNEAGDKAENPSRGFWPALVDGLVGALSSALIAAAGALVRDNLALREKLKEAEDVLAKQREVERRRRSDAERERVRAAWGDDRADKS